MDDVEEEIYLSIPAEPAFRLLSREAKMLSGTRVKLFPTPYFLFFLSHRLC
jgi:hypothetical protein